MLRRVTLLVTGFGFFLTLTIVVSLAAVESQTRSRSRGRPPASRQKPRVNYAEFSHTTHVTKEKMACDACHKFPTANWKEVRKGDAAYADVAEFPEHAACLDCHRQQFFARQRPAPVICSNCHVAVTPRNTARFLFPSLGDVTDASQPRRDSVSEFAVHFPHETHLEVVSRNTRADGPWFINVSLRSRQEKQAAANCGVCHQTYQPQGKSSDEYATQPPKDLGDAFWLKKGTFKTVPNSHTGCFSCHNAESGIAPVSSDCQTCHKLPNAALAVKSDFDASLAVTMKITDGVMLNAWRERISSGPFRHEGGAHPDLACADCHPPARLNTADVQTLRVPVTSCAGADGCHATATLDEGGILNYEIEEKKKNASFVCTKCHITFGKQGVPASHVSAIPKPAK
ncbi:MAG TPA: cytochrome c3 family protein [Pyrinomonadaceae bacterium]|nr:cytochrome c3 family protein [Pyrinomonadaceae bacterium]